MARELKHTVIFNGVLKFIGVTLSLCTALIIPLIVWGNSVEARFAQVGGEAVRIETKADLNTLYIREAITDIRDTVRRIENDLKNKADKP